MAREKRKICRVRVILFPAVICIIIIFGFVQFPLLLSHRLSTTGSGGDDMPMHTDNSNALTTKPSRRFVKYTSSEWEQLWLDNIAVWEKDRQICQQLKSQGDYLRSFMKVLCTHIYPQTPWCSVDDGVSQSIWWFHLDTGRVSSMPDESPPAPFETWDAVLESTSSSPPRSIIPKDDDDTNLKVFSRLDFINDYSGEHYSEYIEPLVSHLRHPLSFCDYSTDVTDRSYIVPPPPSSFGGDKVKTFYYDAGASQWNAGKGGPSLSYFTKLWKQQSEIDFHHIECWEGSTSPKKFDASVPNEYRSRITYHQEWIASSPNDKQGRSFLPHIIEKQTSPQDYVLFKLDIDNGPVEKGSVEYLLQAHPSLVDEFVWEHHAGGNYLLKNHWNGTTDNLTVHDSYQYFLQLRQRGIRAHSWV